MIYDADTWIGHWPFRSLPRRSAGDLLRQMDKHGIEKALVASLHGLFYTDAHEANHELAREIRRYRDRLVPCAILNPTYYGWQQDLKQCREEFGMPVLRMVPDYHGYRLSDPCAAEMAAAAQSLNMLVALIWRIVDPRGRHRLDPGREANIDEVHAFVRKFPHERFLLLNFPRTLSRLRFERPACFYDMNLFVGKNGLRLEEEVKRHGAERFVFGSTMLLRYGWPARLALEKCPLSRREREMIQWKNLARLVPEMAPSATPPGAPSRGKA